MSRLACATALTGTVAGNILLQGAKVHEKLNYTDLLPIMHEEAEKNSKLFEYLVVYWFSTSTTMEHMLRGNFHESAVIKDLRKRESMVVVHEVILLEVIEQNLLPRFLEGIALLIVQILKQFGCEEHQFVS